MECTIEDISRQYCLLPYHICPLLVEGDVIHADNKYVHWIDAFSVFHAKSNEKVNKVKVYSVNAIKTVEEYKREMRIGTDKSKIYWEKSFYTVCTLDNRVVSLKNEMVGRYCTIGSKKRKNRLNQTSILSFIPKIQKRVDGDVAANTKIDGGNVAAKIDASFCTNCLASIGAFTWSMYIRVTSGLNAVTRFSELRL